MADYFLISLSNRENLELCIEYGLAGFTNSINGLWTFFDIDVGDYVSFLYGARVRNLYKVTKKVAYKNAENLPPWPPITFRSKRTYYFPFRLVLKQEREFNEPMVRPEFSYVAENLLLRGGYRKTHFQADTVTFYNVSEMGTVFDGETKHLELNAETFEPKIVFKRENQRPPEKFYFRELVLQSLVRRKIQYSILKDALEFFGVDSTPEEFEVLGEKALPEGYVDIFIKLRHPRGTNKYLPVEVKTGKAQSKDLGQLMGYINEFSNETVGGILIAKDFPRSILNNPKILAVRYYFKDIDPSEEYSYEELLKMLTLEVIE
ncbi:PDDEXK family nuclease [Thermococcus thioreducens]|uniref:DUF91 domain-containing protein n=2 Tax=Thermococcus thioreducens TaxID=277988 RepID=A0A1I0Q9Z1_9EURY|nr:hypothetical protein [Thermococcus thioreducens]ASJ13396.1 hypothetical protein A3L14_11120 [Thermococcus thioreducens]SEW23836.1 hypothetical protein SAMN05216170_2335 [Thermococcus thioreducens]